MKRCDDSCDKCIYLGEGEYMCSVLNKPVIINWMPVNGTCIKNKKKTLLGGKK